MKLLRLLFLFFVPMACIAANTTYQTVLTEMKNGNFKFAEEMIDFEVKTNLQLTATDKQALLDQKEIMRRIRLDFSKTEADVMNYIKRYYPKVTPDMFINWETANTLEHKIIDGEKRYFNQAAPNLFRLDTAAKRQKEIVDGIVPDKKAILLQKHIPDIIKTTSHNNVCMGNPQKMTVTYTLTVKPDQVPDGKTIRCWLPYPRTDVARQKNVKLFSVSQNNYQIAPNSCAHKTIYMEQKATKGKPAKFQIVFSYECYPEFHNLEHQTIAPLTDTLLISDFLKERKPHIVFSDAIKQLSAQIVGTETNPYQKAKKIFTWIRANYPWASAREYSTIPNIPEYVIANRHGDCGQVSLLLITLCRYNGIPARWQSGFMMHPGSKNLHDWAEIYLQNIGWVAVDVSFGVQTWAKDPSERYFYLGGQDAYRWIINTDFGQPLSPAKQFMRSETVDFQRGEVEWEGGNLYFNQWNYTFNIAYK